MTGREAAAILTDREEMHRMLDSIPESDVATAH